MSRLGLTQRDQQPELMDQPGLDTSSHRRALYGLRLMNVLSLTSRAIFRRLRLMWPLVGDRPLTILDVATGGGDVLLGVASLAKKHGLVCDMSGCDISPTAVEHAFIQARRLKIASANFFQHNILEQDLPGKYDVVMCSLFLHHLMEEDAIKVLQRMARSARHVVLIDDLRRTQFGYLLAWTGTRIFSRSRILHEDGPQSVRAAYSPEEARKIASAAGLTKLEMHCHWPQRFLLTGQPRDDGPSPN